MTLQLHEKEGKKLFKGIDYVVQRRKQALGSQQSHLTDHYNVSIAGEKLHSLSSG